MLNTFHLRTFVAVADAGSYSAAAALLHLSQPAVSQHIRALEDQLDGVRLFRRVGKKMAATHAGEELLRTARELVTLATHAEESIRALKGQLGGRVLLGCTPSSGERLLAPLLAAFRARFPSVALDVQLAPAALLLEWMAEQQVHVLLMEEQQRRRNWESTLLGSEPMLLLAPRGHPLLQQEQVPPGALREQPLILPRAGTPLRRAIEDALRRRGLPAAELHLALESDSTALAVQCVRAGLGLAFVPLSRQPRSRDVGVVTLAGIGLRQEWYALRTRDGAASQARDELFAFLTGRDSRAILTREGLQAPSE
jgi:DNA-binding transcriptional LysR family regulator